MNPAPKLVFRWPRAWYAKDAPVPCLTLEGGERGKVGNWFMAQEHVARILECGCAVCVLCGNLLMWEPKFKEWHTANVWAEKSA